jgi:chaperonin cofactor prefoldin
LKKLNLKLQADEKVKDVLNNTVFEISEKFEKNIKFIKNEMNSSLEFEISSLEKKNKELQEKVKELEERLIKISIT